jgi:hypothetical protein
MKNLSEETQESIEGRLRRLLDTANLSRLIEEYLVGPVGSSFAGLSFDQFGKNLEREFTGDDLVAVSMLDVRFGAKAIHHLLTLKTADPMLGYLPPDQDLWKTDQATRDELQRALKVLDDIPGVGRTKASKLLARKRPRLAPICDSVTERFYATERWDFLDSLAECLSSDATRTYIEQLKTSDKASSCSTLRILDIAIWMTGSNSRSARQVRSSVLGSPDTLF